MSQRYVLKFLCVALSVLWTQVVSAQILSFEHSQTDATPQPVVKPKVPTNVMYQPALDTNEAKKIDNVNIIKVYIRDLEMSKDLSAKTHCSIKIYAESHLPTRISNLSFRLKWPDLETAVSFDNLQPRNPAYRTHAFVGNVCYSLDKIPNIIVNRCRVKNMPQQKCADSLRWVK